jgi:hypothetical protein
MGPRARFLFTCPITPGIIEPGATVRVMAWPMVESL